MKAKLTVLALSIGVIGSLLSIPAHANVYADSRLLIDSLKIGGSVSAANVTNFTFTTTNTAVLNGAPAITTATCSGAPGLPGGPNDCSPGPSRLDGGPANAPGGDPAATRGVLDFSFKGPGTLQFSNSASSIDKSELLGDGATFTRQIAESQLINGKSASANAEIQSITGLAFTFAVGSPGHLTLDFLANPDMHAEIFEALSGLFSAQANMSTLFSLRQLTGGAGRASWEPSGTATNDCVASGGLACVETADAENLNGSVGTTTNGTFDELSHGDSIFGAYGIDVTGLTAGTYRLTLDAVTSTQLSRKVPEPASLLLAGSALAALGLGARRRQKKQAS